MQTNEPESEPGESENGHGDGLPSESSSEQQRPDGYRYRQEHRNQAHDEIDDELSVHQPTNCCGAPDSPESDGRRCDESPRGSIDLDDEHVGAGHRAGEEMYRVARVGCCPIDDTHLVEPDADVTTRLSPRDPRCDRGIGDIGDDDRPLTSSLRRAIADTKRAREERKYLLFAVSLATGPVANQERCFALVGATAPHAQDEQQRRKGELDGPFQGFVFCQIFTRSAARPTRCF